MSLPNIILKNGNRTILKTTDILKTQNFNYVVTMTRQFLEHILNSWLVISLKPQHDFQRQHYSMTQALPHAPRHSEPTALTCARLH